MSIIIICVTIYLRYHGLNFRKRSSLTTRQVPTGTYKVDKSLRIRKLEGLARPPNTITGFHLLCILSTKTKHKKFQLENRYKRKNQKNSRFRYHFGGRIRIGVTIPVNDLKPTNTMAETLRSPPSAPKGRGWEAVVSRRISFPSAMRKRKPECSLSCN